MPRRITRNCTAVLISVVAPFVWPAGPVGAQEEPSASSAAASAPAAEGLLPVPNYAGGWLEREYLTGDWYGVRTALAEKGVQLEVDFTQYFQSVASGGVDDVSRYGGHLDYLLHVDLMRAGLVPGGLITVRAESRYGESVNKQSGSILPVNTLALFPFTDHLDDDLAIAVTNLNYIQFFSEHFAALIGKIDTLDGDLNEFASGRGKSQFMNANFVFNPVVALRLPYSTLGVGAIWIPTHGITWTNVVMNTVDSSTTTGFGDIGDGGTWSSELDTQYRVGDLPGGTNVSLLYSFDQKFHNVGGRLIFQPGEGLSIETSPDTWAVYWSSWQYLLVEDPREKPIDLRNGTPDHEGLGVFTRFGMADPTTNPVSWAVSIGLGGRGTIPTRDNDVFGVGYYYTAIQDSRLTGIVGLGDHTQGMEAFYNLAITPAAYLTVDLQVVESILPNVDTAVIPGLRLNLSF